LAGDRSQIHGRGTHRDPEDHDPFFVVSGFVARTVQIQVRVAAIGSALGAA
jgi:hypothetical protein